MAVHDLLPIRILILFFVLGITGGSLNRLGASEITEEEAREIAVDAYVYFYPLITMDITRKQSTNMDAGKVIGRGPMNYFVNVREYPPADFRDVVRSNFDTLYSSCWLDMTKGPVVNSSPDTQGRYFLLPMLDM